MTAFVDVLKMYLRLSSPLPIVLLLGVGVAGLFWRASATWARRLLVALVIGYGFLSTGLGANILLSGLRGNFTSIDRLPAGSVQCVVLLGGGASTVTAGGGVLGQLTPTSALRALEAARVARLIDARLVIASGGIAVPGRQLRPESELLREALVSLGVPPDRVLEESTSRTTQEEAQAIRVILRQRNIDRFVLVTSPPHMRRAIAAFRAYGLQPIPSVARLRSEGLQPPLLLPNEESLYESDMALYDYAASVYYWIRGDTR
jgi:uncharacterized SAM-binding protein YcdF (DUF218 family)